MLRRLLKNTYLLILTGAVVYLGVCAVRTHYELEAIDHDYEQMISIRESQLFAFPIVRLAEQLAAENAMFTTVIDRARELVQAKEAELASVREALQHSVAALREQAIDLAQVGEDLLQANRLLESREAAIQRQEAEIKRMTGRIEELEAELEAARRARD